MTIYGTKAKIIGMFKLYSKYFTETKYIIVAKSDLDKDKNLTITLKYFNTYADFGRYCTLFTSIVDMEINEGDDLVELTKQEYPTIDNYLIWLCAVDYMMEELNIKTEDNSGKSMYEDFLKERNKFIYNSVELK